MNHVAVEVAKSLRIAVEEKFNSVQRKYYNF